MHSSDSRIGIIDTGDMLLVKDPDSKDITTYVEGSKSGYRSFGEYGDDITGMDAQRLEFYRAAERADIGLTVMKTFAGGRLLDPARSPFGVALTPTQCIHYALTRPAVSSVLIGYSAPAQVGECMAYETADADARDYASVLASAPRHPVSGLCTYCGHCAPCTMGIDIAAVSSIANSPAGIIRWLFII